jgi:iron complex outermembrane recepter protein
MGYWMRPRAVSVAARLSMFACGICSGMQAMAQQSDPEELIVTASRGRRTLEDLPLSISVIDQAQMQEQLRYDTNVLRGLELVTPGFSPQTDDRNGCGVEMRGRTTSFQINGVPVNQDLRQSSCNAMFQISPFAIERAEVVRGGTALYGAGAPGGIVNMITRRPTSDDLEIDAVVQSNFYPSETDDSVTSDLFFGAGQAFDAWDYYAGFAYTDAGAARTPDGGYVPSREYDSLALNASVGFDLADQRSLRFTGTLYDEEPGATYSADGTQVYGERYGNVVRVADHPQLRESKDQLSTLSIGYDDATFLGHELIASLFYQDQRYSQRDNFYDVNFGGDFFFASETENDRLGVRTALTKRFGSREQASATYGIDYGSNRFYRPIIDPAQGGVITGFVAPETTLRTSGLFGQFDVEFGDLRFSAGARQEWYRGEIGGEGYDPSLEDAGRAGDLADSDLALWNAGVVYQLNDDVQLYGGFSQGAELSEIGRSARGVQDPALISPEPAKSDQLEVGVRRTRGELAFEAAAFRSESDRAALLEPDPNCAGQVFCPLIPLRLPQEFWGLELSTDWQATDSLLTRATLTWQRGEVFNEDLGGEVEYSNGTIAPLRLTAMVRYAPSETWRFGVQAIYYGEADFYSQTEQALGFVNTDSQFLLDADVGFSVGAGDIYIAASNLLDDEYVNVINRASGFDFFYYQAPGRALTLGYSGRF